jgi:hypothetical protein
VVRHLAIEPEPTEPAIGQVQVHLLAQAIRAACGAGA